MESLPSVGCAPLSLLRLRHTHLETPEKAFAIKLTPPELGAVIHAFDKDGDGVISCPEFLLNFFRLGEDAVVHPLLPSVITVVSATCAYSSSSGTHQHNYIRGGGVEQPLCEWGISAHPPR